MAVKQYTVEKHVLQWKFYRADILSKARELRWQTIFNHFVY